MVNESGAKLLDALVDYFREYIRIGSDEYTVLAVWVLHCHAFRAFTRTPYLHVTSPAPDCGKTQLLEVTELVVPEPINASSLTAAVLARSIEADQPVLMVDEFDQLMAGDKEFLAAVLATINSGYKKSGCRYILEMGKGGGWQRKRLSTFCPKILSGISSLPPTTKTRCIPIHMERLAPGDRVADPDEYIIEPQAATLKTAAAEWARKHIKELSVARPDSPAELRNRQREVARPLFATADAAGGDWGQRVREAVIRLFSARDSAPSDDVKLQLLADLREVFANNERISTTDLLKGLHDMEDKPWATWGRDGKGMNAHHLARQLRDFNINSRTLRTGSVTFKGYESAWFADIWSRYLPNCDGDKGPMLRSCDGGKVTLLPAKNAGCDDVTDRKGDKGLFPEEGGW